MSTSIERVAVIGAGTMGAAIAAHVANAGTPVLLLDIAPDSLTPEEEKKGLGLDHPAVRNRIVDGGLARIAKLEPASFMSERAQRLVETGNLEDDFDRLAEVDWIIEAIIERLDVKRALMERIDGVRRDGTIVTTNTSGLPIASIIEGRSDDLRRHFFGTHFFNPPRYMKLLEIIAGDETDPAAIDRVVAYASRKLGKGVVRTKDTPNFIGNRILSVHGSWIIDHALSNGYSIEEVDAITGPLLGRPKTATFRLQDLVGLDVASGVAKNLYDLIPDDPHRQVLRGPAATSVIQGLLDRDRLGNKSGAGFYRKNRGADGKTVFEVLDPETFDYRPAQSVRFAAVGAVRKIEDIGERLDALFADEHRDDRGAQLARAVTAHFLAYAAAVAPEVAFDLPSIDDAVRWGFSYEDGPFELWDRLGVARGVALIEEAGMPVADWVEAMLAGGHETFYRQDENGRRTGYYDWQTKSYADVEHDPRRIRVDDLRAAGREIDANPSAALLDLGDGILLLEFRGKMNAIDDGVVAMMTTATTRLEKDDDWVGLVIGNDAANFCVGANLMNVAGAAQQGAFDQIDAAIAALQHALVGLRAAPAPVVAAVHGMALGGGCEIALAADRVVAAAESYIGLVEVGVGLLPAGGGLKEMVRRHINPVMQSSAADALLPAQQILQTVGTAKVSTSAAEARDLGFLAAADRVVMNRDDLLFEAKQEALGMVAASYAPPAAEQLYAGGRDLLAAMKVGVWSLEQAGFASAHDALVAGKIARVIAGGDGSGSQWLSEDWFLGLERQGFVELVKTEATQARIRHMLETGKPLRN